jgi:long-chain acyl-CoA synthetase
VGRVGSFLRGRGRVHFFSSIDADDDTTAFITEDSIAVSYRELLEASDRLGEAMGRRCLIVIACRNSPGSIVGYLGALRSGAVPLLVGGNIDGEFLRRILDAYRPEFIWLPRDRASVFGFRSPRHEYGDYVLLETDYVVDYELHDELALLLGTSGSTGSPKFVRLSYSNIDSNTRSIAQYLDISDRDRPITTLPMEYSFGLSIINSHLLRGCSIILSERTLMEKEFWGLLKAHHATVMSGVPYTFEMLKKLRFFSMDLPSIRTVTQAGGKLRRELAKQVAAECEKKGVDFFVMYGQAEAAPRISFLPSEKAVSKAGSIGVAIPGGRLWLENEEGEVIVDSDTVGELVYQGDNVCYGYAVDRRDLSVGDLNGGVLRTGDMAKRDEDGCYYIVGRMKRFLKLFGNRVNLDEMEEMLSEGGWDCAVAGEDDRMRVFVTSADEIAVVKKYIVERTKISPVGFVLEHVGEIPRNAAGKVLYGVLSGGEKDTNDDGDRNA